MNQCERTKRSSGGDPLRYDIVGRGAGVVLFLHGFGGARMIWKHQIEALSTAVRCVSVDLPGHGESPWKPFSTVAVARSILDILDIEELGDVHVVGSSYGGAVALRMWEACPEVVRTLTLMGALPRFTATEGFPAGLDPQKIRKLASQFDQNVSMVLDMFYRSVFTMYERRSEQYQQIKQLRQEMALPKVEALFQILDMLEQEDLREVFASIKCPVLCVFGDEDPICPKEVFPFVSALLDHIELKTLKECGHFPFLSQPVRVNGMLKEFCQI